MNFLEKFDRFNHRLSSRIEWVGLVAILFMMMVTTVNVIAAKLFQTPIPGALDSMELSQVVCIAFAIAASLLVGRHVQVEFFVPLLPNWLQRAADLLVNLLGLLLFVLIVWRLFVYGSDLLVRGEVSATARIPLYPFSFAAAAACVPVCLVYLHACLKSISRMSKT